MIIKLVKIKRGEWKITISQGVQFFDFAYRSDKKSCEWMVKAFKMALRNHDKEVLFFNSLV
jgi:hypothetical protein